MSNPPSAMKKAFRSCIIIAFVCLASPSPALAVTYYVDFADGSDERDGRSPETAWKRSPGDKQAVGNPKAASLQPGDVIKFKGGVQ